MVKGNSQLVHDIRTDEDILGEIVHYYQGPVNLPISGKLDLGMEDSFY
jgi:hypothetical protein